MNDENRSQTKMANGHPCDCISFRDEELIKENHPAEAAQFTWVPGVSSPP